MTRTGIYLNFNGNAEEAFNYYKKVFKTEFIGTITRMKDVPPAPGAPRLSKKEENCIMHIALPIIGGTIIYGTDALESMGQKLRLGNNFTISLEVERKEDVDRLYKALSEGGSEKSEPRIEFWGDYWGSCQDRFGVRWMFDCPVKEQPAEETPAYTDESIV